MPDFQVKTKDGLLIDVNKEDIDKLDYIKSNDGSYHVIFNNKSYIISVDKNTNCNTKHYILTVNDKEIELDIKDSLDQMLDKMGFLNVKKRGSGQIKSPMPGLVVKIDVKIGQTVEKNDTLLTLEAMKMENLIKAPTSGVIKSIDVKEGAAVDKNQLLVVISE